MTVDEYCEMEYNGDFEAMCLDLMADSIVPGICTNEGCEYVIQVEPDARNYTCEECETNTVQSVVELLM